MERDESGTRPSPREFALGLRECRVRGRRGLPAIAERYGVTSKTVHLRFREERGVPMRDTQGDPHGRLLTLSLYLLLTPRAR